MKRLLLSACLSVLGMLLAKAQTDTVYVSEFGIHPYTYKNYTVNMQQAIRACKERGTDVLAFEKGRYDFWTEGAVRKEYFITNTSSEQECPSKIKTIGMLFEDMDGLTIEGNGATLMFHGKMTMIAFEHCQQMKLHDLHIDFERPGGSEMTYTKVTPQQVEVRMHPDSRYEIADGRIHLYGEGWRSNKNHCIEYDPESGHFFYSNDWNVLASSKAENIAPGIVRFTTPENFHPQTGHTLTVRDIIRDQVGMFIYESKDITLEQVGMHYMHGLGIVSQYTRNITMKEVCCMPREGSGRILASSADFMHFSGCSGKVLITGCRFAGAQDDPINVHGTNLRIIEKTDEKTLRLRFMHAQSYGYNAFFEGDTVAYVKAATMQRMERATVTAVKRVSDRIVEVTLDRRIPNGIELNHDCLENISCTPEVEISRCHFTRTSTRGTLVTTPRKVVIAHNTYYKTGMSAILIEGDAEGWYESGPVEDVRIENNTFVDCAYNGGPGNAVIALNPSNKKVDANAPVHRNIRIIGNVFETAGNPVLYAKSTEAITVKGNTVTDSPATAGNRTQPAFWLNGCKKAVIRGNRLTNIPTDCIRIENMKSSYLQTDAR